MVKKGRVLTPHADYCLPGITRATVRKKKNSHTFVKKHLSNRLDIKHFLHFSYNISRLWNLWLKKTSS